MKYLTTFGHLTADGYIDRLQTNLLLLDIKICETGRGTCYPKYCICKNALEGDPILSVIKYNVRIVGGFYYGALHWPACNLGWSDKQWLNKRETFLFPVQPIQHQPPAISLNRFAGRRIIAASVFQCNWRSICLEKLSPQKKAVFIGHLGVGNGVAACSSYSNGVLFPKICRTCGDRKPACDNTEHYANKMFRPPVQVFHRIFLH